MMMKIQDRGYPEIASSDCNDRGLIFGNKFDSV